MKRAFITGIAGQDGSYLAELLLQKNYEVHGLVHGVNGLKSPNLEPLLRDKEIYPKRLHLYPADLNDAGSVQVAFEKAAPDEIYHLAGQSHVGQSFEKIEETCRVVTASILQLLELVRKSPKPARFFNASSSEIFGRPNQFPQNEDTPFSPVTPYGCAKSFGTQMVRIYRETFELFAVNGILFNHESPRRGENFVTRKICRAAAAIKSGKQRELILGDLSAQRDWGNARDYVRGMWLALQFENADDFIFATGKLHSVQEILEIAFAAAELDWQKYVRSDPKFIRPVEPKSLVGNAGKANRLLNWKPEISFEQTIVEMTKAELTAFGAASF